MHDVLGVRDGARDAGPAEGGYMDVRALWGRAPPVRQRRAQHPAAWRVDNCSGRGTVRFGTRSLGWGSHDRASEQGPFDQRSVNMDLATGASSRGLPQQMESLVMKHLIPQTMAAVSVLALALAVGGCRYWHGSVDNCSGRGTVRFGNRSLGWGSHDRASEQGPFDQMVCQSRPRNRGLESGPPTANARAS